MHRVLFVCHGNICRSTMAQSVMQDIVDRAGASNDWLIDSAATSTEELGNGPHPGTRRKLGQEGVPLVPHRARQIRRDEYDDWDLIVYMDDENRRWLRRILGSDPDGKVVPLLSFAPDYARGRDEVADPWYTGNFEDTWDDVLAGCQGLWEQLSGE